jgi:hypothetical protein
MVLRSHEGVLVKRMMLRARSNQPHRTRALAENTASTEDACLTLGRVLHVVVRRPDPCALEIGRASRGEVQCEEGNTACVEVEASGRTFGDGGLCALGAAETDVRVPHARGTGSVTGYVPFHDNRSRGRSPSSKSGQPR